MAGLARERCSSSAHPRPASGGSLGSSRHSAQLAFPVGVSVLSAWAEVSGRAVGGPLRSCPAPASVSSSLWWPWVRSPGVCQALSRGPVLGEPDGRCRAGAAGTREQTQSSRGGKCHAQSGVPWRRGREREQRASGNRGGQGHRLMCWEHGRTGACN